MSNEKELRGSLVSKKEADKEGFNYDMFDYEAKMVATMPNVKIIDSVFRISGNMAITLNEPGTHYLIFKIGDNKGFVFEQINAPIRVATKAKVFGETFTVKELIEALKKPIFDQDDALISIHTKDFSDGLTAVYKCSTCDKIHLLAGHFEDDEQRDNFDSSTFIKTYVFKTANSVLGYVSKKELLDILETVPKKMPVLIETIWSEKCFTLTNVFKCSETCPSIHLDSAYDDNTLSLN
jgi:hypothetical protein